MCSESGINWLWIGSERGFKVYIVCWMILTLSYVLVRLNIFTPKDEELMYAFFLDLDEYCSVLPRTNMNQFVVIINIGDKVFSSIWWDLCVVDRFEFLNLQFGSLWVVDDGVKKLQNGIIWCGGGIGRCYLSENACNFIINTTYV